MNKKFYYLIGIFLFCLLILNFRSGPSIAYDNDNDGVDDGFEYFNARDIKVKFDEQSDKGIEIESILRVGEIEDEIEYYLLNNSKGFSIKTEYETESGSDEFELIFRIAFVSIIEYNDTNGDGMFNSSNDGDPVKEIKLNEFQQTIYYESFIPDSTNKLYYFGINTTDGIFTAHIFAAEEFCIINSTILTPTQIKVDIEINNFPFEDNTHLLALNTTLASETEYEDEEETEDEERGYSENEEWLITEMNATTGFLSWNKSANVDGKIKEVLIGNSTDMGNFERRYINYPNGTHIYHDPKIGVAWILKPIPTAQNGGGGSDKTEIAPILNIIYILAVILIIGASIAAASIYHYNHKKNLAFLNKSEREISTGILGVVSKSSGNILKKSRIKGELLKIFEGENSLENLSQLNDINITAISEDFVDDVDQFNWEESDKQEFIKEMLALTPKERNEILKEMKERYFSNST